MKSIEKNQKMIDKTINQLKIKLIDLKNELSHEIDDIEKCQENNKDYKPNSAGIIQVAGNKIDNLVGRITSLYDMREILEDEE